MPEALRVGVPRALLHFWFAPVWEVFLRTLGLEPVISPPTNKTLLGLGLRIALDEVCLPVKLFLGHAAALAGQCDVLLVSHLVSLEKAAFTCPKFMGLPDLVREALPDSRSVVATVDVGAGLPWEEACREVAAAFGYGRAPAAKAWRAAREAQANYEKALRSGQAMGLDLPEGDGSRLAVLGHAYCLYDPFINMDLLKRLTRAGCRVLTPEMLPPAAIERGLAQLPKELFWSFGRRQLGAANYLIGRGECDGLIHLSAFACGPEAMIGELIGRGAARHGVPLLRLHLDEHTGEAGFLTRIEAFLDMLARRPR